MPIRVERSVRDNSLVFMASFEAIMPDILLGLPMVMI